MKDEPMQRRAFFRTAGRTVIGGGLAALAGLLASRGKGKPEFMACDRRHACKGCPRLEDCPEPAAHGARNARQAHE